METNHVPPRSQNLGERIHHLEVVSGSHRSELQFDDIYVQYFRYVAAVALRLLGDDADVDDVVQEVFWDCSKKVHRIRDMAHARRWLIQVTVRKTRKLLRRRRLAAALHLPLHVKFEPVMPTASADDRAALVHLFSLLETVPVNHRLAWCLRYLEGAGLQEVAEACDCSLATAKRRIKATQAVITGGEDD